MHRKSLLALCAATITFVVAWSAVALAAAGNPAVTVRVEGKTKTRLLPTVVHTPNGYVVEDGAPKNGCPAHSGAGALDVATDHHWRGKWDSDFNDYFITRILGEPETGKHFFWEIFVDNVAASTGACGIRPLHNGERLLFAAVSVTTTEFPLALKAPHQAQAGKSFKVKVVWFNGSGKPEPLAGAKVFGGGISANTNGQGFATITDNHPGKLSLRASKKGYVRAAPVKVQVSS